jgi:hypothetical protein
MTVAVLLLAVPRYSDNGEIKACFNIKTGALRIWTAANPCKSGEAPLSWNEKGPQDLQDQRVHRVKLD